MMPKMYSNLHKHSKDRKMFLCSILLFALSLVSASDDSLVSASDDEQQSLRCGHRKHDVCDELNSLRTEVDVNTADRRKWNRYFQFVQRFHRSWEDEVAIVVNRIIDRRSPSGDSKLTNDVLNDNRQLRSEMVALQTRLDALESASSNIRSEVEKEREARKKIENEVKETLPSLFLSIPSNLTQNFGKFRNGLESLNRKIESLESQGLGTADEVDEQRDIIKKMKWSITKLNWATLTFARILQSDAPPSMADEIIKVLDEPLGDLEHELPHFLPGNFSTANLHSKALDELNYKVGRLQAEMRVITDMIGKTTSKLQILEGKYNDALRAQVRPTRRTTSGYNYEFVQKHPKPGDRRPFDPNRDP